MMNKEEAHKVMLSSLEALDVRISQAKEEMRNTVNLKDKIEKSRSISKLKDARMVLLRNMFALEDALCAED